MHAEHWIESVAKGLAREIGEALNECPHRDRGYRLSIGLEAVSPRLARSVFVTRPDRQLDHILADAICAFLESEVARMVGAFEGTKTALGLGASPPDVPSVSESDDVVFHNLDPGARDSKKWLEWQAKIYRGLWYPAFLTSIADLTQDDIGLATAFLGGKLTAKGCPPSDLAKKRAEDDNFFYRIFHGVEMVAGIVAGVVLTAIYGPIAGVAVNLAHQAKMAVIDHFWKEKVARDPALKLALEKLKPDLRRSYQGFAFWTRPYGNLIAQELGCKGDLQTRILLHGRMLRTLDLLASSAPTAKSGPGLYDYPSSFGSLKGSIFPPRGRQFEGEPPPKPVVDQAKQILSKPAIQAILKIPATSLSSTAAFLASPKGPSPEVLRSAENIRQRVVAQESAKLAHARAEKPSKSLLPLVLVGGAALGVALCATRSS